jgi:hypothetical protein
VLASINLNNDLQSVTGKIREIRTYCCLPAKMRIGNRNLS